MHMSRLLVMSCLFVSALAACGDDGGKGGGMVDAPKTPDAAIDAPGGGGTGPTQLGKKCTQPTDCPATAPECVAVAQSTNAYCTPKCLTGGSGMTNAQGGLPLSSITPAPNNGTCTTAFTGTPAAGTIGCGLILKTVPADNPLMANKQYTGIELGCIVLCGMGGVCPMGMTCSAATNNQVCLPN